MSSKLARKGVTRKGLYPDFANSTVLPEARCARYHWPFCGSQQHPCPDVQMI